MSISGVPSSYDPLSMSALQKRREELKVLAAEQTTSMLQAPNATPATATKDAAAPVGDQFRGDFGSLVSAVQSGDMAAAQQALQTLQADRATYGQPSAAAAPQAGSAKSDFQTLIGAIQSGDSTAAQKALDTLQSTMAVHGKHGHHHHSGAKQGTDSSVNPGDTLLAPSSDPDGDGDPNASNTVIGPTTTSTA